jgi:hypothetical protein
MIQQLIITEQQNTYFQNNQKRTNLAARYQYSSSTSSASSAFICLTSCEGIMHPRCASMKLIVSKQRFVSASEQKFFHDRAV